MPDKAQFVSELCRVLRPGGRLILVAWTHRDLTEGEVELKPKEEKLLQRISQVRKPRLQPAGPLGFLPAPPHAAPHRSGDRALLFSSPPLALPSPHPELRYSAAHRGPMRCLL